MIKFGDTMVRSAVRYGISYRFFGMLLLLLLCGNVNAQGSLSGKVTDAETGEPILFGDVILYENGVLVTETQTDFDGNYEISPIDTGNYEVVLKYIGYLNTEDKIEIVKNEVTIHDAIISQLRNGCPIVIRHYPPLGDADDFEKGATFTAKDIRRMPNKN